MGEESMRRDALLQAGLVLASELSLPSVLQKIVDLACQISGARYGALGVLGPDDRIQEFLTHGLSDDERTAIGRLPHGEGILGVLIHEAHPLRLARIQDHPRSVGFPAHHPPMTTFLGVPVAIRGRVFGNLYLTEKHGGEEFSEEDEQAVVVLAIQAGVAIESARLREELQRLAIVEDRERIAKELHDDIVQSLFAEGMALQAARAVVNDPAAVDLRLAHAVENLDRVIRDLRNYVFGLRPGASADVQLARAIEDLARGFEDGSGIAIEASADEEAASLVAGRATDVLQAVREAISNAVRHSGGDRISVRLARTEDSVTVSVEDNGKGFDPAAASGRGQGLTNLRDRAESLGGALAIDSVPERGTRVTIEIRL